MLWYNVEIQVTENEGVETSTQVINARESEEAAITAWHGSMSSMRASVDAGTLKEATGFVVNSWGGKDERYSEHYMKPEPAPAPAPVE